MNLENKKIMIVTTASLLIMSVIFGGWHLQDTVKTTPKEESMVNFKGSLLAISDADMLATAYADGILNKVEGIEDSLSFISFSNDKSYLQSQVHVSNSVISWPSILAWHSGKNHAYVAETRGIYRSKDMKVKDVWKDMPIGKKITVIDYSDRNNPQVMQDSSIGENIQGVSINRDGNLLVAGSREKGKEIIVARLNEGLIKETFYFTHDEIEAKESNNSGIRTIEFHPRENIIAANLNNTKLVFFEILSGEEGIGIKQIGPSLEVAKMWSVGNWHPTGKYFILTDVAWGKGDLGAIFNGKGKLVSVDFDPEGNHKVVSTAKVGLSPEGFDVSPDGKYAIVANMRRTYGPKSFWFVPARKGASLSLVKINPETGQLNTLGKQYGFEGALPEDAVFDLESNTIAVAVYHEQDNTMPKKGWIEYWEVQNEELIRAGQKTMLTRGVHNLLVIKN